jgi:hypothetical protein
MAQVICKSKYAQTATLLGGKKFFASEVGRISEEMSDDEAAEFLKTPTHFVFHVGDVIEEKKPSKKAAPAAKGVVQKSEMQDSMQPGF